MKCVAAFLFSGLATLGAADLPGVQGQVGCFENPRIVERLAVDRAGTFENYRVDGRWGESTLVKITANAATLRHCEILNGSHNGVAVYAKDVVIDSCRIHHQLKGSFTSPLDAHGITGTPVNLTIRNCEIFHVSGDAVQFDPGRRVWDYVTIEHCTFWKAPLQEDAAGFKKGEAPGENAVDTKQAAQNPRSRLTIRNSVFRGWKQPAQIDLIAALNLKNNVEVLVEDCVFFDNEVCFRLRGPDTDGKYEGAKVTITDCAVYDSAVAVRIEDRIRDLRIRRLGFGSGVSTRFMPVGGGAGEGYENVGEYSAPPLSDALRGSR